MNCLLIFQIYLPKFRMILVFRNVFGRYYWSGVVLKPDLSLLLINGQIKLIKFCEFNKLS